jgi:Holliday junction resolvase-like predicted endonuclease
MAEGRRGEEAACRFDVVLVETTEDGKPRAKDIIWDAFRL